MTERMTAAALKATQGRPREKRKAKYGNQQVMTADGKFDSKREAARWAQLLVLERAGQIRDLKRQVRIVLMGRDGPLLTETGRQRSYVADFTYFDIALGAPVVEDSKGCRTKEYLLKKAILAAQQIDVKET